MVISLNSLHPAGLIHWSVTYILLSYIPSDLNHSVARKILHGTNFFVWLAMHSLLVETSFLPDCDPTGRKRGLLSRPSRLLSMTSCLSFFFLPRCALTPRIDIGLILEYTITVSTANDPATVRGIWAFLAIDCRYLTLSYLLQGWLVVSFNQPKTCLWESSIHRMISTLHVRSSRNG
jgi:hypothetical protein